MTTSHWLFRIGFGFAAGGAGALLATSLHGLQWTPGPERLTAARAAADAPAKAAVVPSMSEPRLAALEEAVRTMQARAQAQAPAPDGARPAASVEAEAPPRASRPDEGAVHADLLARHNSEPVDPTWAPATTLTIQTQLAASPGTSYQLEGVDCRSTTCVANLRWSSRTAADQELDEVVGSTSAGPCTRRLTLPNEAGERDAYRASLFFDCSKAASRPMPPHIKNAAAQR